MDGKTQFGSASTATPEELDAASAKARYHAAAAAMLILLLAAIVTVVIVQVKDRAAEKNQAAAAEDYAREDAEKSEEPVKSLLHNDPP